MGAPPIVCDVDRIIRSSRICFADGQTQICYEQKMALQLMDLFKLRAWLHKFVYQHHTVNVIEEMICDTLRAADEHITFLFDAQGRQLRRLSEAVDDPRIFAQLGDWILNAIESSASPQLAFARSILKRLRSRSLYYSVCSPIVMSEERPVMSDIREQLLAHVPEQDRAKCEKDLLIHFTYIDFGCRKDGVAGDPIEQVRFFNPKTNADRAESIGRRPRCDLLMPRSFSERLMYVYSRTDESWQQISDAVKRWRETNSNKPNNKGMLRTPVATGNQPSPGRVALRLRREASRDAKQAIPLKHHTTM